MTKWQDNNATKSSMAKVWHRHLIKIVYLFQYSGVFTAGRQLWSVGAQNIPSASYPETGALHAGSQAATGCHVTHHGQRGNILRSSCSLHIYLQVCTMSCYMHCIIISNEYVKYL